MSVTAKNHLFKRIPPGRYDPFIHISWTSPVFPLTCVIVLAPARFQFLIPCALQTSGLNSSRRRLDSTHHSIFINSTNCYQMFSQQRTPIRFSRDLTALYFRVFMPSGFGRILSFVSTLGRGPRESQSFEGE